MKYVQGKTSIFGVSQEEKAFLVKTNEGIVDLTANDKSFTPQKTLTVDVPRNSSIFPNSKTVEVNAVERTAITPQVSKTTVVSGEKVPSLFVRDRR